MTVAVAPSAAVRGETVMIWNAARGGMRSVVESYDRDGFIGRHSIRLIASYADGGFVRRQMVLISALARFVALLSTRPVALVHVHMAMRGSFWRKSLFVVLGRLRGARVVLHLHGSEMRPFYESQAAPVRALIRRRLEDADRVVVLSESWRGFIAEIAPRARTVVVPNHVGLPAPVDPDARVPGEILFLGLVGRRKGVFDLLEAFPAVLAAHPQARLVIGGNGTVEEAREAARRYGVDHAVRFLGWVDGPAKEALLARASVFVLPSHNEGLPMSVLEAMAAGLPVVTTPVGGIPEAITDGLDGLLVPPGATGPLAGALVRLLDEADLRRRIGEAARARIADRYATGPALDRLDRLYRDVLDA